MATLLLTLGLVAIFFIFMSVRLIFLKNGEFKGTCASQNPYLNPDGGTCSYCGKSVTPGDDCDTKPQNEVEKVMARFK